MPLAESQFDVDFDSSGPIAVYVHLSTIFFFSMKFLAFFILVEIFP